MIRERVLAKQLKRNKYFVGDKIVILANKHPAVVTNIYEEFSDVDWYNGNPYFLEVKDEVDGKLYTAHPNIIKRR